MHYPRPPRRPQARRIRSAGRRYHDAHRGWATRNRCLGALALAALGSTLGTAATWAGLL